MPSADKDQSVGRRRFLKLAGTGVASVSVAGCTGDGGQNEQTTAETDASGGGEETTEETTQETTEQSVDVPEFVWLLVGSVRTLDPGGANDWPTTLQAVNFYDNLLTVDPEDKKPVANIATEWTVEDDGTTWVFSLREDVSFHRGQTLTADDVAYSLNRIMGAKLARSSLWQGFVEAGGASARDDTTVEISTTSPYGPLIATLVQLFIVNSTVVQENASKEYGQDFLATDVAGSGPYQLPEPLQSGDPSEIEYEAFEDYWQGWESNQFRRARMRKVKEPSTNKTLMKNGEAHMTSPFLSKQSYAEMDGYENVSSFTEPRFATWHISMHTQKEPTNDLNVRKAMAHAFDYQAAIENIFGGQHAAGPVPVNMFGHNEDLKPYTQDLDRAQQMLEQSDYTVDEINEIGLEHVYVSGIERQRKLSLILKNSLSELGIEVKLNPLPWPQMVDRAAQKDKTPHTMNLWFGAEYPSPDSFLTPLYHSESFGSFLTISWFTTPELEETLNTARSTLDTQERIQHYKDAQRIVWENYPGIYIANPPLRIALNDNVGGFQLYGVTGFEGQFHNLRWTGD